MNNYLSKNSLAGSPDLHSLTNSSGTKYLTFKNNLSIRKPELVFNICLPLLMISSAFVSFFYLNNYPILCISLFIPLTIWISFWKSAYKIHFHEAAHFNLSHNKFYNDMIANIFFTPFVGMWIKDYRKSHWKHHKYLGTFEDTEISYQKPINFRELLKKLTGVFLIYTVLRYFKNFKLSGTSRKPNSNLNFITSIIFLLIIQVIIFISLFQFISLLCAVSWAVSVFLIDPFLSGIRQTLEHRSENASKDIDYSKVAHGPNNKIFGSDFFSKYFGGAGFNKHLLHHYDPSVSYTEFDKLEEYLLDTKLKNIIKNNTTTYRKTLRKIIIQ